MRRIALILTVCLTLFAVPLGATAQDINVTVSLESPTGSQSAPMGGQVLGRVKFMIEGQGKTIISGRFIIDGYEGPSYFRTIDAPTPGPLYFDTVLPTLSGGRHEVYFELLSPNQSKTAISSYNVTEPVFERVFIINPTNGLAVEPGQKLMASGEIKLKGWGLIVVEGNWIIDGNKVPFSHRINVANEAFAKLSVELPTNVPGDHIVGLEVRAPFVDMAKTVTYKVIQKAPIVVSVDPAISGAVVSLGGTLKVTVSMNITGSGPFNILGYLLVDGNTVATLEKVVIGPGQFSFDFVLPSDKLGPHTVQFKLVSPVTIASNIAIYRVVGEGWVWPRIISPADGTTVMQGSALEAELGIKVGGKGTVKVVGVWLLDGNPWKDYEQMLQITSETIILEKVALPTDAPSWHTLKFRLTWPHFEETNEIWYRVWGRNQPPSFIEVSPIPGPPYPSNTAFQLHVRASDDRGLDKFEVKVDGNPGWIMASFAGMLQVDWMSPTLGPFPPGEHFWSVIATDVEGLSTTYNGKFLVVQGQGSIEGIAIERNTNRPVEGAWATCSGKTTKTDMFGKYRIDGLGAGEHFVTISHPYYKTGEARVLVHNEQTTQAPAIYLDLLGPVPVVYQIEEWPAIIYPGQTFTLSVYVRNDGKDAGPSEVAITCPDGAFLEIDPDTGGQYPSFSQVFAPGAFIEHRDGQTIRALFPVAIVRWNTWGSGVVRKVLLKVTVQEAKKFSFWVRTYMKEGDYTEFFPRTSDVLDQQGWPVRTYDVTVLQRP